MNITHMVPLHWVQLPALIGYCNTQNYHTGHFVVEQLLSQD